MKPPPQRRRPKAIIGMEYRRIRLRPTLSMRTRATHVMTKLVDATVSEVSVGLAKPIRVNMVAEKYMREFCNAILAHGDTNPKENLRSRRVAVGLATNRQ